MSLPFAWMAVKLFFPVLGRVKIFVGQISFPSGEKVVHYISNLDCPNCMDSCFDEILPSGNTLLMLNLRLNAHPLCSLLNQGMYDYTPREGVLWCHINILSHYNQHCLAPQFSLVIWNNLQGNFLNLGEAGKYVLVKDCIMIVMDEDCDCFAIWLCVLWILIQSKALQFSS